VTLNTESITVPNTIKTVLAVAK